MPGSERMLLFPALRRTSSCRRLWLGAGCALVFLITVAGSIVLRPGAAPAGPLGLDFFAFYSAGDLVRVGRVGDLYRLDALVHLQRVLAQDQGLDIGSAAAVWWNPPVYAWLFVPLSNLPFHSALTLWTGLNLFCAALAAWMLAGMLPPHARWRHRMLVPVLIALSAPFINSITHGQNSCISLALVTGLMLAWRSKHGLLAGVLAGILFYKPQLALLLSAALVVSLGWRPLVGLGMSGAILLLVTVTTLPGSLGHFLHEMPANLHYAQTQATYNWDRHVTFLAFWRLLVQGTTRGEMSNWVAVLAALSTAAIAVALISKSPLRRWIDPLYPEWDAKQNDRLIAAVITATPLLMPFYFDYDLLLLAIPAVLLGAEAMAARVDRRLVTVWVALYATLMVSAGVAAVAQFNIAVPVLAILAWLTISRMNQDEVVLGLDYPQMPSDSRHSAAATRVSPSKAA